MTTAAETARLRQGLYRFFGGVLTPLDDQRLESLHAAAQYLNDRVEEFAFSIQWRDLLRAMAERPSTELLAAQHVRLFASGMDDALCPPTESYYRQDAAQGAIPEMVANLQREYRVLGLESVGGAEAADHAATQLEAMSVLCDREALAWETQAALDALATLAAEESFLKSHLAAWFPLFRDRVSHADPGPFYRALIDAAHAYLVHEVDLVAALRAQL